MKDANRKAFGALQPLKIPERPWSSVSMDFITHLPRTAAGYDAITVFVDRLTKMVHLVPGRTDDTADTVAKQFFDQVFQYHGIPTEIVSDRDSKFTSQFWRVFIKKLGIKRAMSSAFHPETDGQMERTNRTVEQILRIFVDYRQMNWDSLLPFVEFCINNQRSSSTGHSPFYLNTGQHPMLTVPDPTSNIPQAQQRLEQLKATLLLAKDIIRKAQDRQAYYADAGRVEKSFSVGDSVMLDTANITEANQRNRPSRKLAPRWAGPYEIVERVGAVAYRLALPHHLRVHPVFHVSRIKEYNDLRSYDASRPVPPRPEPDIVDGSPEWEVERILDRKGSRSRRQYLVHWKGYPDDQNSWEPLRNLRNAMDLVGEYDQSHP